MKKAVFTFCLFTFFISLSSAQVNRYTTPSVATYEAMSFDDMYKISQIRAGAYNKRNELFMHAQSEASKSFNRKNYRATINYCNQALSTNLENDNIYYLRGVSFVKLGLTREGKKDLKKSAKKGNVNAKLYLKSLKRSK